MLSWIPTIPIKIIESEPREALTTRVRCPTRSRSIVPVPPFKFQRFFQIGHPKDRDNEKPVQTQTIWVFLSDWPCCGCFQERTLNLIKLNSLHRAFSLRTGLRSGWLRRTCHGKSHRKPKVPNKQRNHEWWSININSWLVIFQEYFRCTMFFFKNITQWLETSRYKSPIRGGFDLHNIGSDHPLLHHPYGAKLRAQSRKAGNDSKIFDWPTTVWRYDL